MADQEAPLTLSFAITVGDQDAGSQEFEQEMVTIGKAVTAVLQINDPALADLHCAVQVGDDGVVTLLDLGSESGTLLNGESVNNAPIADGAEIRVGNTVLKLGVKRPEPPSVEEQEEQAAEVAKGQGLLSANEADAAFEAQFGETEPVMDFVSRSGTADSDLGINRGAPKVLEVVQVWSGTVQGVRHFDKGHSKVTVGDRTVRPLAVASGLLIAILLAGTGYFMWKHTSLPQPPEFPEGDEALMTKWNETKEAERQARMKKAADERKKRQEAIEAEADERIAKDQRKYDREAAKRLDEEKKEDENTDKDLAFFQKKVRDEVIDEVEGEWEEREAEEEAKNAPPDPLRDRREAFVEANKKAYDDLAKKLNREGVTKALIPPQFGVYEQPDFEVLIGEQMFPVAEKLAAEGKLTKDWLDTFDQYTREHDLLDDLDVKRVAEDLVRDISYLVSR